MVDKDLVNPKNTAILVIDIQNDYCSEKGILAKAHNLDMRPVQAIIPKISAFLNVARKYKIPIIWTQAIEDPDYLKPNAAFKIRSGPKQLVIATPGTWGFDYYKIRPLAGDFKIVKKGYDSFVNPQLNAILRQKKTKNVIVCGVYTAVCVDTTVRSAYRLGYNVVVPRDLVAMPKQRWHLHEAALLNMDMIFAHVLSSEEIIKIWEKFHS